MTPRMLIFDWDGTLCDSLSRIARCLQLAAGDCDLDIPSEHAARQIVGLGLVEAIETLFPGIDGAAVATMRDRYATHFRREDRNPSPFFPGVKATLDNFREQGFLLAVATGKSRAGLDRVLSALSLTDYFDGTRCADETASKPHPLMLQSLLKAHSLSADQAVMVGDTTFDMEMARRSSMPRVAVDYGAHSANVLAAYDPIACISDFTDISRVLTADRALE